MKSIRLGVLCTIFFSSLKGMDSSLEIWLKILSEDGKNPQELSHIENLTLSRNARSGSATPIKGWQKQIASTTFTIGYLQTIISDEKFVIDPVLIKTFYKNYPHEVKICIQTGLCVYAAQIVLVKLYQQDESILESSTYKKLKQVAVIIGISKQ